MSLSTSKVAFKFDDRLIVSPIPDIDGPDISWLSRCHVGDDQGHVGSCAIQGMASHAEAYRNISISDAQTYEAYQEACKRFGIPHGQGMTPEQAYEVAKDAGWFPYAQGIERTNTMSAMIEQPLLGGYKVTDAWDPDNMDGGVLDHSPKIKFVKGYHMVLIAGWGTVPNHDKNAIAIENSWALSWGQNGIGYMDTDLHNRLSIGMWRLKLK